MANRYWIGGTGNWSDTAHWAASSNGTGGQAAPTATDDVFLDSSSGIGNITIDSGALCQNLTCTGYTGTLTFTASLTSTPTTGITLASGMTIAGSATLNINPGASTTVTLTSAGKSLPNINKVGSTTSTLQLADNLTLSNGLTITTGIFNTNNKTCSFNVFISNSANTRSIILGSSAITITGTNTCWDFSTTTGLAFNAGTSSITFSGASVQPNLGGQTYYDLTFSGGGNNTNIGGFTCHNFTFIGTAVKSDAWYLTSLLNYTISGTLTLTGNSTTNRLLVCSSVPGTVRTINAASVSLANVDFADLNNTGSIWSGTSIGDCGNNTNITAASPQTNYWVGGVNSGSWSDSTKWANASNGTGGTGRVPLPQDTARFDASSVTAASRTIIFDMPRLAKDINFSGVLNNPGLQYNSVGTIYGSLTLASGMTTTSGNLTLVFAGRGSHTVTSAGYSFPNLLTFTAPGATYTLQDTLTTTNGIVVNAGTLNTNDVTVTCVSLTFGTTAARSLVAGTSTFNLTATATGVVFGFNTLTNQSMSAANATFFITGISANTRTFGGGGFSYGRLAYIVAGATGTLIITGANTFKTISFSDTNNARTLTLPASTTTTVTNFDVYGTAGKLMTINSSISGTAATIALAGSGATVCNYLSIQDSTASGGSWYAGPNSTNTSGNTNWNFSFPSTMVAAGGGNWSTAGTWQGGVVPTAASQVIVSRYSGNVTINTASSAQSFEVLYGYSGTVTHASSVTLSLGDSSTAANYIAYRLGDNMTHTIGNATTSLISFISASATTQNICCSEKTMPGWTVNSSTASYRLLDTNTTIAGSTVTLTAGTLDTNNQACFWSVFNASNSNPRTLTLGSSNITVSGSGVGSWNCTVGTNLTLNAGTSTITASGANASVNGGGKTLHTLVLSGSGDASISSVTMTNFSRFGTTAVTDGLKVCSGITINGTLTLNGNSTISRIFVHTADTNGNATPGTPLTISCNGTLSVSNTDFMDITGAGSASWNLAAIPGGSGDCGGNSGITFTNPSTQIFTATSRTTGNFLQLNGVTGNYASAPDSNALDITDDIEIIVRLSLNDWTTPSGVGIVGKWSGSQNSYVLRVASDGALGFYTSPSYTAGRFSNVLGIADGTPIWVRVTYVKSTGVVSFYYANDQATIPSSWISVGSGGNITTGMTASTAPLEIGGYSNGSYLAGNIYRVILRSTIGGTAVFDADFTTLSTDTSTFIESSVNAAPVTIHGSSSWSTSACWSSRVPLPQDDISINTLYTGCTVTADIPRLGKSIDFGTSGGTFTSSIAWTSFGSITLSPSMTVNTLHNMTLGGRGNYAITSASKQITASSGLTIAAPTGTYSLQDALIVPASLTITDGAFTTNNNAVTCATFAATSSRTTILNFGTSTINLTSNSATTVFNNSVDTTTTNGSQATFVLTSASVNTRTIAIGQPSNGSLGTVTYTVANSPGVLLLVPSTSGGQIGTLNVDAGKNVQITAGRSLTIGSDFNVNGSPSGIFRVPGVAGNYASTPDSPVNQITTDITIDVKIALDNWLAPGQNALVRKMGSGSTRVFGLDMTSGYIQFLFSPDGASLNAYNSSIPTSFINGTAHWVRGCRTASTGVIRFYTSSDGISWVQLGSDVAGAIGSMASKNSIVEFGTALTSASAITVGNFYNVRIYNSDLGNSVGIPIFDADFTSKPFGTNYFIENSANAATVTTFGVLSRVSDGRVALSSSAGGTAAILSKAGSSVVCDYLVIQDSTATGGSSWFAKTHSINVSNNSGWHFTDQINSSMLLGGVGL